MAKRFFDSGKYQDPWFRKLAPKYKLFWDYILCSCDHAGIWKKDFEMATFCIGIEIFESEVKEVLNGRIIETKGDKWFIPKFVEFQYGILNDTNRPHKSVIDLLQKEGVYKEYTYPLQGDKAKDTYKDKDKDKDNSKGFKKPTLKQVTTYCKETKSNIDPEIFWNNYESSGWVKANGQKVKNWKATIKTWEKRTPIAPERRIKDL